MLAAIAVGRQEPLARMMCKVARRLDPAGVSVGKVADVTLLSQELRAARRTVAGSQGGRRPPGKSDPGAGGLDRGNRRQGEEDQQVGLMALASVGTSGGLLDNHGDSAQWRIAPRPLGPIEIGAPATTKAVAQLEPV